MKIAAGLCWYDEPVEFLDRCVRSLAGVVDEVCALDGGWEPFPDAQSRSPVEQVRALNVAIRESGLLGIPIIPQGVWRSQIEKRAALMRDAQALGADWILVIDADEYVAAADPAALRAALADTTHDVAEVTICNVSGDDFREVDQVRRRIFRADHTLTVAGSHQGYRNALGWLHGDATITGGELLPALDVTRTLRIEHTPRSRGDARNRAAVEYRHARAAIGER